MQDSDRGFLHRRARSARTKKFDATPTFMTTPTDKREQLTDLLEYSSILCAIAIKKQQIAVPEHK